MVSKKITVNRMLYAILAAGCLLRLFHYCMNYSLWFDEAQLALAILDTPLSKLHLPLFNKQVAPLGYLYIVKSFSMLF